MIYPSYYPQEKTVANYAMTLVHYHAMVEAQGGCCAICKKPASTKTPLAVDHDHTTGEIRGLLCYGCNGGLGHLGDTEDGLLRALAYLQRQRSPLPAQEDPPAMREQTAPPPPPQSLLTAKQVLALLGIPKGTLYRMAARGMIPTYKVGLKQGGVRFVASEVSEALRRGAR